MLVFAAVRFAGSFANRPASVADGSTLVLDLEGDVPERLPAEIPIPLLQSQTALSLEQVWDMFPRAAADSRIRGVLFEPRGLDIGWGKMEEIHDDIVQFRKSGKPDHHLFTRSNGARILSGSRHRQDLHFTGRLARPERLGR